MKGGNANPGGPVKSDDLSALLSMALNPKPPPQALKRRLWSAAAEPALELTRSWGRVWLEDDTVRTGAGAGAELRVRGRALVAVKERSWATLRRGTEGLELLIQKGAAIVNVATGTPFTGVLPLGRLRVRGTWFYAESRGPGQSYLCLCEGRLSLRAGALRRELASEDHTAMLLTLRNGVVRVAPADPNHWEPETGDLG